MLSVKDVRVKITCCSGFYNLYMVGIRFAIYCFDDDAPDVLTEQHSNTPVQHSEIPVKDCAINPGEKVVNSPQTIYFVIYLFAVYIISKVH